MSRILIAHAWPYANSSIHAGHLAGVHLPADVFARYCRARGRDVLVVSGSDEHGTPITLRAEQEGVTPASLAERYHAEFRETWAAMSVAFDHFARTTSDTHREVVQAQFLDLLRKGFVFRADSEVLYDEKAGRFLPDRYVEGRCPVCGHDGARGDQCEACGRPLSATDLLSPRSRLTGTTPTRRTTEHCFLDLPRLERRLVDWVGGKAGLWRANVRNFTSQFLRGGLQPRAITRDLEWGVPVPLPGWEGKRIYVWFEAVTGYLSATVEWASRAGADWRPWWREGEARHYYFIGKDNIPFHTIIWPAILLARGDLALPYDVPASEFVNFGSAKLSKSRGAMPALDLVRRYGAEALRYYLLAIAPETGDSDFVEEGIVERNDQELVAVYGNLAHRVLTFVQRYLDATVPPHDPDPGVEAEVASAFDRVGELLEGVHVRDALRAVLALARFGNQYFERHKPWVLVKADARAADAPIGALLDLLASLRVLMHPFLPDSSDRLHAYLGGEEPGSPCPWRPDRVPAGRRLPPPSPLFRKLAVADAG